VSSQVLTNPIVAVAGVHVEDVPPVALNPHRCCPSSLEPGLGLEPTTYRLQGGRYPSTTASTCNCVALIGNMNHVDNREVTSFRVMTRVTRRCSIFRWPTSMGGQLSSDVGFHGVRRP
jgi:hypothetical protein